MSTPHDDATPAASVHDHSSPSFLAIRTASRIRRPVVLVIALLVSALTVPFGFAQKIELSVDTSKTGAKIDRNIFGQFAEHLGHGIYDGIWVGRIPKSRIHAAFATMSLPP